MMPQIKSWLTPPVFADDEEKTYRATLFNATTLTILIVMGAVSASNIISRNFPQLIIYMDVLIFFATLTLRGLVKKGKMKLASMGLTVLGPTLAMADFASLGTIRPASTVVFLLAIVVAGLIVGSRGLAALASVSSLAVLGLLLFENGWRLPPPGTNITLKQWVFYSSLFALTGSLTFLAHRTARQAYTAERQKTADLLQTSQTNFSTFFNNIDDLLFVLDMDGKILKANATACQRLEYTEEELIGQSVLMVHPPERRSEAGTIVAEMLAGKRKECPVPVMTQRGNLIDVETRITRGKWDGKDVLFGVTKDISALKRSEDKFYKAFYMNPTLMAISTLEEGRYVDVNDSFCATLGYQKDEVVGKTALELHLFEDIVQRQALLKDFELSGALQNTEFKIHRRDGCTLEGLFSAERIDLGGEPYLLTTFVDISERKRLENELQNQHEFMTQVVNNMGQGLTVTDTESLFEFVNPAYAKLFGYTPQDLIGKSPQDITASTDQAGLFEAREARRQGKTTTYESSLVRSDGTIAPVLITGAPRWKDGKVAGAIAVITDLTEIKRAQEAVRESETKYRIVAENTHDWEFWANPDGKFIYVSPACKRISGYEAEAYKADASLLMHIVHPDDLRFFEKHQERSRQHQRDEIEYRIVHADGSVHWLSHICFPMFDENGEYLGQRGINRDITERKQMEEALATERRRLADILEGTNVGSWEWNVQTGETIFNERWADIIGYTLAELVPISIETWVKFVHPDDLKRSDELLEKHFRGEMDYYETEARMRHKNGEWVWVLDRGKVATWAEDGKPLLMSGTHQDITQRKQAEEALRNANQELKKHIQDVERLRDKLREQALHDALTGLYNRHYLEEILPRELARARRDNYEIGILMIDIDFFKQVNDIYGHKAGDEALQSIAHMLVDNVRAGDIVCRYGGDEMICLLTNTNRKHVSKRAEELRHAIAGHQPIQSHPEVRLTMSVGATVIRPNAGNLASWLREADEALYRAKAEGRNRVCMAS